MITYHDKCTNCSHEFEYQKSIKDKFNNICPECGLETLERVIDAPPIGFVNEGINDRTTLGKLAEINTKSMGKYELQEKREIQRVAKENARQVLQNEMSEKFGTKPIDVKKKPWYRKIGPNKINKMSTTQKQKYIEKGEH